MDQTVSFKQIMAIANAWKLAGPHPVAHEMAKLNLKRDWPTLYNALKDAFGD